MCSCGRGTATVRTARTIGVGVGDGAGAADSSKRTTTTIENIVASISCVEQYRKDTGYLPAKLLVILNGAAAYGQLQILEWAHQRRHEIAHYFSEDTTNCAVKHGQLAAMIWLNDRGFPFSVRRICCMAAENGHLNILQWLKLNENGNVNGGYCRWEDTTPTDVCSTAAKGGHFHILKWASENGGLCDSETCANAAEKGRLDILKWLIEIGCPWDSETCANAAGGGHLNVIQWARENGCPWDEWSCSNAACGGHIDTLKWLRKNGCPWNLNTYYEAENGEYPGVWNYVKDNYRHRF